MSYEIAFNSVVCAAAVVAASYAPDRQRRQAIICALALFPIWALYTLSFDREYSPAILLNLHSKDIWAALDLFGGMVALLVAGRLWWGKALFLSFFLETIAHTMKWDWAILDRHAYYWLLDKVFYAQGALFIAIGGPGFVERISVAFGNRRGLFRLGRGVEAAQAVSNRD